MTVHGESIAAQPSGDVAADESLLARARGLEPVIREHAATSERDGRLAGPVLEAMREDTGIEIESLKVDGGATVNDTLMQMQADILGLTVIRPKTTETTALGAAYVAGLAVGVWKDTDELKQHWREDRRWNSTWTDEQRTEKFRMWRKAVARSMDWIEFP